MVFGYSATIVDIRKIGYLNSRGLMTFKNKLLKSLENCLREKMKTLSRRHAKLAKAFSYALNQWAVLTYYADDGWAEADNNIAENPNCMLRLCHFCNKQMCKTPYLCG